MKLYPLTYSQKNIWYTEKAHPGTSIGNVAGTLRMKTDVDFNLLEKAINKFVEINDGMRLQILEEEGIPSQYVAEYSPFKVEFIDFSKKTEKDLYEFEEKQTRDLFALIDAPLFKFYMIKLSDTDGGFYIKTHHIISDAWNMTILGSEIAEIYAKLKKGETEFEKKPSYLQYIDKLNLYVDSDKFKKDREFWMERYNEAPSITVLKEKTSKEISTTAKRKTFVLPKKLTQKIYSYSKEKKISIFSMYMAALSMYINRVRGKDKINVGTNFLNRSDKEEKNTIGMFVTTIPVSIDIDNSKNFAEFSSTVTTDLMKIMRHQRYPFSILQEDIRKKFNIDDVLYDIVLSYQNAKFLKFDDFEISTRWHFNYNQTNSLTIHINDRDTEEMLIVDYDYLKDIYYDKEIDFIHDNIERILWHALDNSQKEISKIEMISEKEKDKILNQFNDTKVDYPKEKTLDDVFREQVKKTPNNIAASYDGKSITYKELDEKSDSLALKLQEQGVKPDDIVGIMLYRSLEMIISIQAIIKAGGAYMPIDPDYPNDRIEYMLNDSASKVLLTTSELASKLENINYIDVTDEKSYKLKNKKVPKNHNSRNLAYVIYTSGSTGKPKGAMIEHYSVINRINWMQNRYPMDENDVILQKTPYTFDVSVWEMFWWSFVGAKVCFLEPGGQKYPDKIIKAIKENNVTVMHFVPSMLNAFLDYIENYGDSDALITLKQVFASGEALTVQQVKKFNKLINSKYGTKLSNLYGPTEATVDVSYYDCETDNSKVRVIPIGKPIDNIQLYVLDKNFTLLPIGAPGELYIAGDGLARGYVNRPELTSEKFIPNPFTKGARMYRTGDLARWMGNGDIEYLGRIDNQIKIRGNRVELGEIETNILAFPGIKEAVVIARDDDNGNKYLCAYYVAGDEVNITNLQSELASKMPKYMVPSYFVKLDRIPLSANGKIDRKALPKVEYKVVNEEEKEQPTNKLETILVCEVEKVLDGKRIGINENFFSEGVDSLSVITLQTNLSKRDININTEDFYKYQTVHKLAEFLYNGGIETEYSPLVKLSEIGDEKEKVSVICFPYGGGNFNIYKKLADEMLYVDKNCVVYGVNLRGHDSYKSKEELISIEDSIKEISSYIIKNIDGNIILYSHCVGAALMMGVLAELLKNKKIVEKIFIGGTLPPKIGKMMGANFDPWAMSTDAMVLKFLKGVGGPEFEKLLPKDRDHFMKAFRHDVKEYYKFFYKLKIKEKYSMPCINVLAEKDLMTKSGLNTKKVEWNKYFDNAKKVIIKDANHYFIKNAVKEVIKIMEAEI